MLFPSLSRVEGRNPRSWTLVVAAGSLALVVLGAGVGLRARAAPAPTKKVEEKKAEPRQGAGAERPGGQDDLDLPAPFEDLFRDLDPLQAREIREQLERARREMREALEGMRRGQPFPADPWAGGRPDRQEGRLGVTVEQPSPTLVEQLDLPQDQGLVVREVRPDSAAERAGLKPHDILLEWGGEPVPSQAADFARLVRGAQANTPVDVLVLRKGRKETIKGLSLPEARAERPLGARRFREVPFRGLEGLGGPNRGGRGVTTMFRSDDRFTTRHREGNLVITVTGTVAGDKAAVGEITVQDGATSHAYPSADEVPARYRDKVKELVELSLQSPKTPTPQ